MTTRPGIPIGRESHHVCDDMGAATTAVRALTKACYRSERAGFRELSNEATAQTVELLLYLAGQWPDAMDDLVVTIGPNAAASVVISFDSSEADITVAPDGREFHVSLYDSQSGRLAEGVCSTPEGVRNFVVSRV